MMGNTDLKPGWQTTEFWAPVLSLLVSALVALHYVPAAEAPTVMGYASALVVGLAGVVGNVLLLLHYVRSRTNAKEMILSARLEKERIASILFARQASPVQVQAGPGPVGVCGVPGCEQCTPMSRQPPIGKPTTHNEAPADCPMPGPNAK